MRVKLPLPQSGPVRSITTRMIRNDRSIRESSVPSSESSLFTKVISASVTGSDLELKKKNGIQDERS